MSPSVSFCHMASFDVAQAPLRRPSGAETTRPRLGATLAPRLAKIGFVWGSGVPREVDEAGSALPENFL